MNETGRKGVAGAAAIDHLDFQAGDVNLVVIHGRSERAVFTESHQAATQRPFLHDFRAKVWEGGQRNLEQVGQKMRLRQVHFQNVRALQRLGNGLERIAILAQVDVQKFQALAGNIEQALKRQSRPGRALRQRAETETIRRGGQSQRVIGHLDEIVSHFGHDEEFRVAFFVERDLDRAGETMVVLLDMGRIHAERGHLIQRFPAIIIAAETGNDEATVAKGIDAVSKVERCAPQCRAGREQVP